MDAFGAVAAGIQIIKDVRNYIDGVRCRTEEIESARSQVDTLNNSLSLIETELRSINTLDPDTEAAVKGSLGTVRQQLGSLAKLLEKLTGDSSSSESLRGRLKDKGKQLSYPFSRSTVHDLEHRLAELNTSLGTALQLRNLQVQRTQVVTRDENFAQLEQVLVSRTEVHKHEITTGLARIQQTQIRQHQQQLIAFDQGCARLEAVLDEVKQSLPNNADTMMAMARLTTQPAAFVSAAKQIGVTSLDTYAATEQIAAAACRGNIVYNQSPCACVRKRHQLRSRMRYSRLSFELQKMDDTYHEDDCPLSYSQQHSKSHRFSVSFRVGNNRNHMSTILAMAINFSSGGNNQWSLIPEIRVLNRVDLYQSPAYRFLESLWCAGIEPFSNSERAENLATYIIEGLARLFRQGKASPYDVDYETGKTLLHLICLKRCGLILTQADTSESFWTGLRLLGFRNDVIDDQGLTPWAESIRGYGFPNSNTRSPITAGRRWILPPETDYIGLLSYKETGSDLTTRFEKTPLGLSPLVQTLLQRLYFNPELFNDLAQSLGPMCRAIISRSIEHIKVVLQTGTSSFGEMFSHQHGIYALDIAALWCPELLLSRFGPQIQDYHLYPTKWPLVQSLVFSLFSTADIEPERVKIYHEALTAVLQSNLPIWWGVSDDDGLRCVLIKLARYYGLSYFSHSPQMWIREIAEQLADRRRRLATFAISNLPLHQVRRLGLLHSMILDDRLQEVVETVESYGCSIPQALIPFDKARLAQERAIISVFHCTNYPIAEALYTAGFRINDLTPFLSYYSGRKPYWGVSDGLIQWLIARTDTAVLLSCFELHGLGVWKWRMLHLLAAHAGWLHDWYDGLNSTTFFSEFPGLFVCHDCCVCGCSSHGCTPFTAFLQSYSRPEATSPCHNVPASRCATWIDQVNRNRPVPTHVALQFSRFCVFTTLECRHTCCKVAIEAYITEGQIMLPDAEERAEVQEEDEAKLALLEHVMALAEECWMQRSWSLLDFWRDFLKPLADAELNKLVATEPLNDVLIKMRMVGVQEHTDRDEDDEEDESLPDSLVSEVDASMYPDLSVDELEEKRLLAAKRAIDRMTGHQTPENGKPTWKRTRRYYFR